MAWRPHGRAKVNPRSPRAFGMCDSCRFLYNLEDLRWQFEYAGPNLRNTRFLVCDTCIDVPQQQLRTIVLPIDPVPVLNARVESYVDEFAAAVRITEDDTERETDDDLIRIVTTSAETPA